MKNKFVVLMVAVLIAALWIPAAYAQSNCTVRGKVIGDDGKPLAGVSVFYSNDENGRKYTIKTDKNGTYYSIAVASGKYKVSLLDASGKPLYPGYFVMALVSLDKPENVTDIDIQKAREQSAGAMSEEQKQKIEAAKKENVKIGALNEKLKLAAQQQEQGQFEDAVKTMEEAAAIDTTHDIVLGALGNAYLAAGRHNADRTVAQDEYTKAVTAFQKAIEIKPTVGAYYNNMGEAYARLGQTSEAVGAYTKAAQNDPTEAAKYYFNLGAILTNNGKLDDANAAFDKAIAADPTKADAYYQKAINLMSKASVDASGKVTAPPDVAVGLNKYLELAPTGQYAQTAKEMLTSLGAKVETSFGKTGSSKKKK